ncbi:MAG: hypothetical protein GY788_14715, partial [bacterium]|nr:hypothetical protein [bacterium]
MAISIIRGTNKSDKITGSDGIDLIVSGNGADWIAAGDGNDIVISGRGGDWVFGGQGNDLLITGRGSDTAHGGTGHDIIFTGKGDDVITGGDGNDLINGGRGWDIAHFYGDIRQHIFAFDHTQIAVTNQITGETDTLANVEVLKFENAEIFLDGRNNGPIADDVDTVVDEDGPAATGSLLAESDAFDFEADPLSVIAVNGDAQNAGGQIALPSGALLSVATDGTYTYDPNGQFDDLNDGETATDSVSFTISDGTETITRTVEFTITGETDNLAPIAEDVLYVVSEGAAPGTYSFDVADENPATL